MGAISQPLSRAFRTASGTFPTVNAAWLPGKVSYLAGPGGVLRVPDLGRQPASMWSSPVTAAGFDPSAPIENSAPQVRRIDALNLGMGSAADSYLPWPVGRFDPGRLAGFSALSRVPLETFRAPVAVGADTATA